VCISNSLSLTVFARHVFLSHGLFTPRHSEEREGGRETAGGGEGTERAKKEEEQVNHAYVQNTRKSQVESCHSCLTIELSLILCPLPSLHPFDEKFGIEP
jgi:hypothetical protein